MTLSDMEKSYADHLQKSIGYLSDIKKNYQNFGKGYHDMCNGMEVYEMENIKERKFFSKTIKQIIEEKLGAIFKTQIKKIELFSIKINRILKKLASEEKISEKAFSNFTTMLTEAEI